ncbi:hypothetical protein A3SI_18834 [Nitritalea halalkaliphila LW7]|uniref:Uncharacterized protein n=1 Tax=Nitritalea halalkaliphila LW7 TaxID=1189621 RepID=I5BTT6_9BACT|nr:hypothetical protein [Nitritalea halalkaliphila]EIM72988.1 hypothetical protein A3SI_18834 [Nitritalea halalkaliphila LW7]
MTLFPSFSTWLRLSLLGVALLFLSLGTACNRDEESPAAGRDEEVVFLNDSTNFRIQHARAFDYGSFFNFYSMDFVLSDQALIAPDNEDLNDVNFTLPFGASAVLIELLVRAENFENGLYTFTPISEVGPFGPDRFFEFAEIGFFLDEETGNFEQFIEAIGGEVEVNYTPQSEQLTIRAELLFAQQPPIRFRFSGAAPLTVVRSPTNPGNRQHFSWEDFPAYRQSKGKGLQRFSRPTKD